MKINSSLEIEIIKKAIEIAKAGKNEGDCGIEPIPKLQIFINIKPDTTILVIPIETIKDNPELDGKTIYLGFNN